MKEKEQVRCLFDTITEYCETGIYPFHMPGHKRNIQLLPLINPYTVDITEIEGFDNLHDASGILLEIEKRAAQLFGAEETHMLVGGSTAGIQSAVAGCVRSGGTIVAARNCHLSVFHAFELRGLIPRYIVPPYCSEYDICGSIRPCDVNRMLDECIKDGHPAQAVIVTSPTYDGVVSDICGIAAAAHSHGVPLIVDEAHGSHFCFHSYFPCGALSCGADVVIQSPHKTLPSMTQTALLHMRGTLADRDRIRHYLKVFQSSSPSYVLMGSIDSALTLIERRGEELFGIYTERLENTRNNIGKCSQIRLADKTGDSIFDYDKGKLLFAVKGICGTRLSERLLGSFKLQMEMADPVNVLAMTSVCDTESGFRRLSDALREINDSALSAKGFMKTYQDDEQLDGAALPEQVIRPGEAAEYPHRTVAFKDSEGLVCGTYICLYPPGIPFAVPGERLSAGMISFLSQAMEEGLTVTGLDEHNNIAVIDAEP